MKSTYLTIASLAAIYTCVSMSTRQANQSMAVFHAGQAMALACLFSCWLATRRAQVGLTLAILSILLYQAAKFATHYQPSSYRRNIEGALVALLLIATAREEAEEENIKHAR